MQASDVQRSLSLKRTRDLVEAQSEEATASYKVARSRKSSTPPIILVPSSLPSATKTDSPSNQPFVSARICIAPVCLVAWNLVGANRSLLASYAALL